MMFCDRLMDYMKHNSISGRYGGRHCQSRARYAKKRPTVDSGKFDNLLAGGDGMEDSGIDPEDAYAVCSAIPAWGRREGPHVTR